MRTPAGTLRLRFPRSVSSMRWSVRDAQQAFFQRVPPISQLLMLVMAIWGPTYTPWTFAFLIIFVHGVFVASNVRTAWGMRYGCTQVEKFASTNWREESGDLIEFDLTRHLIILPAYKESLETLRETLDVLASHPAAATSYTICLGCEEREKGVEDKARLLIDEYKGRFHGFEYTLHPGGLPGEAPGKSSNVSWAAKEMHFRGMSRDIITVMDADTCFASDFFAATASKYVKADRATRAKMMFVAPIFFDRNASDVASPVACTDILWCAAGLGTMYDGSLAKMPTSAYAISTELAASLGFWDTGPAAIGEDLHMAVKAYFETTGDVHYEAIFSPASQCNVVGYRYPPGTTGIYRLTEKAYEWTSDCVARYAQAKRHMWGGLDSGYALRRLLFNRFGFGSDLPPLSQTALELESGLVFTPTPTRGHHSRSDSSHPLLASHGRYESIDSQSSTFGLFESAGPFTPSSDDSTVFFAGSSPATSVSGSPELKPVEGLRLATPAVSRLGSPEMGRDVVKKSERSAWRTLVLLSRLYEGHFNLGFLFMLLTVAPFFNPALVPMPLWSLRPSTAAVKEALPLPRVVLIATALSSHLGTVAFVATAAIFFYYEQFHHITTTKRWQGRPHLGARPRQTATRSFPSTLKTYASIPTTLLFGIIPLYHAQLCHLWTNQIVYTVSAKPTLQAPVPTPSSNGSPV